MYNLVLVPPFESVIVHFRSSKEELPANQVWQVPLVWSVCVCV